MYLKKFKKVRNAGDEFSLILARKFFSQEIICTDKIDLGVPNIILIGSILEWSDSYSIVCGAGFIKAGSNVYQKPKIISCVRGHLSHERLVQLGITSPRVYCDPGVMVSDLYPDLDQVRYDIGIAPHYVDMSSKWINYCRSRNFFIIDPTQPFDDYITQIQMCDIIISSSLHGIVFAHSYGKKALWIEISKNVIGDGYKFYDYYSSLNEYSPDRFIVSEADDPNKISKHAKKADHKKLLDNFRLAASQSKTYFEKFRP